MRTIGQLIDAIWQAIKRQEGMGLKYTNPGNLRDCPWFSGYVDAHGPHRIYPDGVAVEYANGFWKPRTRQEGETGGAHVVSLHVGEGNSLTTLIGVWAPASDHNNTLAYIANVKKWAQIPDENVPLWTLVQA